MKKLALGALFVGLAACGGGGDDGVTLVDAPPLPDTMGVCSPLTQMGCDVATEKCAWIEDQENPSIGHIGCAPNGTVQAGGACTVGAPGPNGYSDCVKGSECVAGTCKQICDHQGGAPACDANHACGRYEGLFESGDMTVAGVCDPKCDPLTQQLLTDRAEACGAPVPEMPNQGCFTFDGIDYTCAPVNEATLALTDRMVARGPASGGAYVNGCAPGFLPFFIQETGSMVAVCSGMCAPLKTDNTLQANVSGDATVPAKLPLKPAPAAGDGTCLPSKKGSEAGQNCKFMWIYNVTNNMLPETPYNDELGICFAPGHYTYDHDMDPGTPARGVPSCTQLAPKNAPPANCTCDANGSCTGTGCEDGLAHEWGCYNTIDSGVVMPFTGGGAAKFVNPAMKDYRVGYGAGEGVRHRFL